MRIVDMKFFLFFLMFPLYSAISQEYNFFFYESKKEQNFRLHPGRSDQLHYVYMDKGDIKYNTLFEISDETKRLVIPKDGFYEIEGRFSFNMNTGNLKGAKAGINFGFVKIGLANEVYIAATRFSFEENNQNQYIEIPVYPTIVYLEKGSVLAPAISSGLLNKPIVNAHLGCEKTAESCTALKWSLKFISDDTFQQKYY